jgi:coatomer subunit beta
MLAAKGDTGALLDSAAGGGVGKKEKPPVQADELIAFPQLAAKLDTGSLGTDTTQNLFDISLSQALGTHARPNQKWDMNTASKLGNVQQLSGFSDPVYAEAYIHVNQ